ncbi:hypothetical protein [Flavobacterium columnare]|uniref:hypothetical protein n=1 Tax=Flavobacterium columnare TaxID=996 RepID=UPI003B9EA6CE
MKLNKTLKILIILNVIISVIIVLVKIASSSFMHPFEDIKAISVPSKYLVVDTLNVDSVRYNIDEGKTTPETFKFCIYLTSRKGDKKEIFYFQKRYRVNLFKQNKIILLRNKINDNVFLDDSGYLRYISRSCYITLYFYFSLLLIVLIFIIHTLYVFKK